MVVFDTDEQETHVYVTTQEDIHIILIDGYEVDDDKYPSPQKKLCGTVNTGQDTDKPTYIEGW